MATFRSLQNIYTAEAGLWTHFLLLLSLMSMQQSRGHFDCSYLDVISISQTPLPTPSYVHIHKHTQLYYKQNSRTYQQFNVNNISNGYMLCKRLRCSDKHRKLSGGHLNPVSSSEVFTIKLFLFLFNIWLIFNSLYSNLSIGVGISFSICFSFCVIHFTGIL